MYGLTQRTLAALSFALICIALPASAQETVRIRGTIERIEGPVYVVKNRDGAELKLTVTDNPLFVAIAPSTMADINVMAAAEAEAKKRNWKMNIAVVDTNGELVHFSRMEGAQIASVAIAQGKARTAVRYRRESRVFYNAFETGHPYVSTLDPTLIASPGGFPLVEGGKLIGAVGCSGGTGDQDAAVCKAGAEVVK